MTTTTIDSDSLVGDIYLLTPIAASETDLDAWTQIELPTNAAAVQETGFYTGLFGYDMTDFFAYCATADACDSDYYNSKYFDGWAIGANITLTDYSVVAQSELTLILALEGLRTSFGLATTEDTSARLR
jgi:hypothetical protein